MERLLPRRIEASRTLRLARLGSYVLALGLAAGRVKAETVVVNDASDILHDSGCAVTGTGTCSLRDAITYLDSIPTFGPVGRNVPGSSGLEVDFNIPGSGVHTIVLGSVLPTITNPVTIDGYTQPGSSPNTNGFAQPDNAVLLIEIDGNGQGGSTGTGCIRLEGGNHTIRGLVVNRCGSAGIEITPAPATGDVIAGNFIGTDPTGMTGLGNVGWGVRMGNFTGGYGEVIGGTDPAARNVISGNLYANIEIDYHGHRVSGNFIGTNAAGTAAILEPTGGHVGIIVDEGLENAAPPAGDTPSLISTNLISGNDAGITCDSGSFFLATGNYIGTDLTGTAAVPNIVGVEGFAGQLGGPNPGDGNVLSGNSTFGAHAQAGGGLFLQGNLIGTDASGGQPLGNGSGGVFIDGEGAILGNVIAYNGATSPIGAGVLIGKPTEFVGQGTIEGNSIFANTSDGSLPNRGLGIDLGGDGPTVNDDCDADSGPNFLQNFPVLTSAVSPGPSTEIQGTLNSVANASYRLEFFSSERCDASGYGPGKVFLGSADVTTDASCHGSFDVVLPAGVPAGQFVTATATTGQLFDGYTSEFSLCLVVTAPGGLQVFSIAPTSGPAWGGTRVVVEGNRFVPSLTLTIGGQPPGDVAVPSSTEIDATAPALPPGTLNDLVVTVPDRAGREPLTSVTLPNAWLADFLDVPSDDIFHDAVETIFRAGIMTGCGGGNYCRDEDVTRSQMAVLLLKAEHGSNYAPPSCTGLFGDVECPGLFADWIEELSIEGVTAGCGGGNYCPSDPVKRRQMAVFLLKTKLGASYAPQDAAGLFADVPADDPFASWVEDLYNRRVTGGCGTSPLLFCPDGPATRGQMAVFLTKMFGLAVPRGVSRLGMPTPERTR